MKNKIDGVQALCDKFAIHLNRYDNGKIDRDAKLILGIYAKTHKERERERDECGKHEKRVAHTIQISFSQIEWLHTLESARNTSCCRWIMCAF